MTWVRHVARVVEMRNTTFSLGDLKVDWIHLAQDRDQWRALVKTIMKFQVL